MESDKETISGNKEKGKCCNSPPDILGGIILVIAGIILLFNNSGLIPWTIWSTLSSFWPVIFILIGLDILSGNSWVLKIMTTVLGLILIAFLLTYSLSVVDPHFGNRLYKNFPAIKKIYQYIQKNEKINSDLKFNINFGDDTVRI